MVTEPARPPRTPAGELARDFVQTRDRFVAATDATLVDLDAKIATLKGELATRAGAADAATTRATQDAVASLEAQRVAVRASLDEARIATAERWQQVKDRTTAAVATIVDTYDDVAAQLRR